MQVLRGGDADDDSLDRGETEQASYLLRQQTPTARTRTAYKVGLHGVQHQYVPPTAVPGVNPKYCNVALPRSLLEQGKIMCCKQVESEGD
jgi:hypothetical protein